MKPYPVGIYNDMNNKLDVPLPNQTSLDLPDIDGIVLKGRWKDIETSPGTFVWTNLDGAIAQVVTKGKLCGIEINAGWECPAWLYSGGGIPTHASSYTLIDTPGHIGNVIPVPGDAVYTDRWTQFINVLGARYDSTAVLTYVRVCGIGNHDEWNIATGATDTINLFNTQPQVDTWVKQSKQFINAFAAAFPTTVITGAMAKPFSNSMWQPAMDAVAQHGMDEHHGRYSLSFNGLSAISNPGYEPVNLIATNQMVNPTSAQMVSWANHVDQGGVPQSEGLDQSLRSAVANGIRMVEVYQPDCEDASLHSYTAPSGSIWQTIDVSGTAAGITPRRLEMFALPSIQRRGHGRGRR